MAKRANHVRYRATDSPRRSEEFRDADAIRDFLVSRLRQARESNEAGVITDLEARHLALKTASSVSGKAQLRKGQKRRFPQCDDRAARLTWTLSDLEIRIPKTVAIETDEFDQFMAQPGANTARELKEDEASLCAFAALQLRPLLVHSLRSAFAGLKGPLAVRSSSLLEDSRFRPFAGVYATYMLPNNHPDPDIRFEQPRRNQGCPHRLTPKPLATMSPGLRTASKTKRWLSSFSRSSVNNEKTDFTQASKWRNPITTILWATN